MASDHALADPDRPPRIAVLIDAENTHPTLIGAILGGLASFGVIACRRAYADWDMPNLKSWSATLAEHALEQVQQDRYVNGKSVSDVALIIAAMDMLHTERPDAFCLVSSDSDFAPLALRLRAAGCMVIGVGRRTAAAGLVNAVDRFVFDDELGVAVDEPPRDRFAEAVQRAIRANCDSEGWAPLAAIGTAIPPALRGGGRLSRRLSAVPQVEARQRSLKLGAPPAFFARLKGPA